MVTWCGYRFDLDRHSRVRALLAARTTSTLGRSTLNSGIAAGLLSYASAWVVIWALTLAPIALGSAFRETGVVLAVVIGVLIFNERLSLSRLTSIAVTLIGTAVLKLGR